MNKKIVATGFFLLSVLSPLRASAATFSNLYIFGDSLSDQGNVFNASRGAIPPSPYFEGRFSNGPIWVDYLAENLELSVEPLIGNTNPTEGINFAFGGATTGVDNTVSLTFPDLIPGLPGLQQQIGAFISLIPPSQSADPNALYIVWAGANDYSPTESSFVPLTAPDVAIANIESAVNSLAAVGAKNIMVVNLPDLGKLPVSLNTSNSDGLTALTAAHNTELQNLILVDTDINLISLDVQSTFEQLLTTPQEFGLTNITTPCITVLSCVTNPDEQNKYLFWDERHPTTGIHRLVGNVALGLLQSESPVSVPEPVSALGLLAAGILSTTLLRQHKH